MAHGGQEFGLGPVGGLGRLLGGAQGRLDAPALGDLDRQFPCPLLDPGFQFVVGALQRFLGDLALRDVADNADEKPLPLLGQIADGEVEGKDAAVLAPPFHLAADADDAGLAGVQIAR